MRAPVEADTMALAALMVAAYRGTIEDHSESEAQALIEVHKTFDGDYGGFVPECSRLVARQGELLRACLVTRWQDRPFVAFSMTAPQAKRRGLARACLVDAMQALRTRGETELRLVVTLANQPARDLYESLGFVVEQEP